MDPKFSSALSAIEWFTCDDLLDFSYHSGWDQLCEQTFDVVQAAQDLIPHGELDLDYGRPNGGP